MSFTASDIQAIAEAEIDDVLDDADTVQNVNACFIEFCEDFRKTGEQTIVVADTETFYDRTAGHLSVVRIADSDGNVYNGEWELNHDRTKIRIGELGTFTVTSLVVPAAISSVNDTINVHDVFKAGIARYCGALFKLKDNDTNADGLRMKVEAGTLIKKAAALLFSSDKRPGMRVSVKRAGGTWTELSSLR